MAEVGGGGLGGELCKHLHQPYYRLIAEMTHPNRNLITFLDNRRTVLKMQTRLTEFVATQRLERVACVVRQQIM